MKTFLIIYFLAKLGIIITIMLVLCFALAMLGNLSRFISKFINKNKNESKRNY